MLTEKEIKAVHHKATKRVVLCCAEYHHHTAEGGCLSGPADALMICKLCENLLNTRRQLREIQTQGCRCRPGSG